jgi:hypothetical protein
MLTIIHLVIDYTVEKFYLHGCGLLNSKTSGSDETHMLQKYKMFIYS